MNQFQTVDYVETAARILAGNAKVMSLNGTWPHLKDGLLPTLSAGDRCEAVMPMNLDFGASQQSTANQTRVKPTGTVRLTLASVFQDRVVFLAWSGMLRLKYELTTVAYSDVQSVSPVEYRYKMNVMPGFEIISTSGRLPVLGNDPYKYDKQLLARWNNRLMKRLTGEWQPIWAEGEARVEKWAAQA